MKSVLPVLISSLLSAFLAIAIYKYLENPEQIIIERPVATYTNLNGEDQQDLFLGKNSENFTTSSPTDFIVASKRVTPAVVNIKALESSGFDWWNSSSFGVSSGSGVIISPDGFIVTNNHVVQNGEKFEVTLFNHREYEAKLIGTDPSTDLALLKIKEKNLPFLKSGNSDSLQVGEWVLAVGNPFNLESTVTAGIVSAKGRNIDILEGDYSIESFIQTDAAVNPGNSGGALVNTNGELVGINTAIITRSGRYEGYSFAIPSDLVQKVIRDIRDYGEVQRGLLGVRIGEVTSQRAKQLGLPSVEGIFVSNLTSGGGAAEAGIKKGDVIIGINEIKVRTIPELQEQIGRFRPGDSIRIKYIRNGKEHKAIVTLKDKYNSTVFKVARETNEILNGLGFELRNLTKDEIQRLRIRGVYVRSVDIGSTIGKTEMDSGYIITKINDHRVSSLNDVAEELKKSKSREGKVLLEGFYENYPGEYYYTFMIN